jgi:hypothetical protein
VRSTHAEEWEVPVARSCFAPTDSSARPRSATVYGYGALQVSRLPGRPIHCFEEWRFCPNDRTVPGKRAQPPRRFGGRRGDRDTPLVQSHIDGEPSSCPSLSFSVSGVLVKGHPIRRFCSRRKLETSGSASRYVPQDTGEPSNENASPIGIERERFPLLVHVYRGFHSADQSGHRPAREVSPGRLQRRNVTRHVNGFDREHLRIVPGSCVPRRCAFHSIRKLLTLAAYSRVNP